jgi:tRNA (guanine-N7-)-methyltransferase
MSYFRNFERINPFSARERRLTKKQKELFNSHSEEMELDSFKKISWKKVPDHKNILEIGFGSGEIILKNAKQFSDNLYIGVEYYKKGIVQLLNNVESENLENVRLYYGNATLFIKNIDSNFFDEIWLMYPDPWPKKKHRKRRFIQKSTIIELSRILKFRGRFLFFTDNSSYAFWGLKHILSNGAFKWLAKEPNDWKITDSKYSGSKYQKKSEILGVRTYYFIFEKVFQ